LVGVGPVLVGRAATCIQIQTDPLVNVEVGGIDRRAVLAVEVKGRLWLPFLDDYVHIGHKACAIERESRELMTFEFSYR
jgi:hypothetical protein